MIRNYHKGEKSMEMMKKKKQQERFYALHIFADGTRWWPLTNGL